MKKGKKCKQNKEGNTREKGEENDKKKGQSEGKRKEVQVINGITEFNGTFGIKLFHSYLLFNLTF